MSAIIRCDGCKSVCDQWWAIEVTRTLNGMNVNKFGDVPEVDLCDRCARPIIDAYYAALGTEVTK